MGTENQSLLKRALTANGLFSILTGLVAAVYANALGELMSLNPVVLVMIGAGVIGFGIVTLVNVRTQPINLLLAKATVVADIAWVVTAAVIIAMPELLTAEGKLLLGAISVVVGLFAVVQTVGIRRIESVEGPSPNGFEAVDTTIKQSLEARVD